MWSPWMFCCVKMPQWLSTNPDGAEAATAAGSLLFAESSIAYWLTHSLRCHQPHMVSGRQWTSDITPCHDRTTTLTRWRGETDKKLCQMVTKTTKVCLLTSSLLRFNCSKLENQVKTRLYTTNDTVSWMYSSVTRQMVAKMSDGDKDVRWWQRCLMVT